MLLWRRFFSAHSSLIVLLLAAISTCGRSEHVCKSVEIRSSHELDLLRNCTHVVGHVSVVNLHWTAQNAPMLLEEITDYLLVYRLHGVTTLQDIFPRLALIRGQKLLFSEYALVVFENRALLDLGLVSLMRIQSGSIRVESNPALCYVDTVNWVHLLGNSTQQHFSIKNNKSPNQCPLCSVESSEELKTAENFTNFCWNFEVYQKRSAFALSTQCPEKCGTSGCDAKGNCCSRDCLTECSTNACTLCANLRLGQGCTNACNAPMYFQYNKRECVNASKCRELGLIPYAGLCSDKCPENYQCTLDSNRQRSCSLTCAGNYVIHTEKDLRSLKDCVKIHGSLTIELTEIKSKVSDLEQVLVNLKEITGYLKVVRSPQLTSLNFLTNLNTIDGAELIDNKYALYVVNNHHLEQIWAPNQNVAILKGHIFFHLNPRLCYDKIMQLEPSLKSAGKVSIDDVSPNSNGERVICGVTARELNVTVELNATAACIKVSPMPAEDKQALLGYLYHYKEAPLKNITLYDGRHGCGHDSWRMDISANQNVRHIITHLKPYTQYAYFVRTLTMTDYHMQVISYSKIDYFRTLPAKPSPVAKMYYHSLSADEIIVHWWPPRIPNGIIDKYIIHYEEVESTHQNDSVKNNNSDTPSQSAECRCIVVDPEISGPTPDDENYYNKEQLTYDEALPDLIYVPRIDQANKSNALTNESQDMTAMNITAASNDTSNVPLVRVSHGKNSKKALSNEEESKSLNNVNKNEETNINLKNLNKEWEEKALKEQDTGSGDFQIIKPIATCPIAAPSVQYQLDEHCRPREYFNGTEVPGHIHSYTLTNLKPEATYRISVRACVAGLSNSCGSENTILAETFSKNVEAFLKTLTGL